VRNIRLLLEFDGTEFKGWQRQNNVRTVQGTLEDAARDLFGSDVSIVGAGRTDAGVHAVGYACNFHVQSGLPCERIIPALQSRLPEDVVVLGGSDAAAFFHARYHASARRYVYRITTAPTALWRRTRLVVRHTVDVPAMNEAVQQLLGTHDFTSFMPAGTGVNPVCNVAEARVERRESLITVTLEADRFLHHMVRTIVGTLLDVGRGRIGPEQISSVLRTRDRGAAGRTAPAHGLTFVKASYPRDAGTEPPAVSPPGN